MFLQDKLASLHAKKAKGMHLNVRLVTSKEIRNPDILEKLVAFCGVNEIDTNFPKQLFDPFGFDPSDFYEQLGACNS